ncbi:MAG TPA: ATP-binding protein [Actinobacteria bacterium]|nr:ATP-binding protein [Actinomycetota bacterium]
MLAKIESCSILGMEAFLVEVEVDISNGLPAFNIVGLPDAAIQESRERVRSGISNSEFEFPLKRITVNLAPADLRKEGPSFDLPVAVGILAATKQISRDMLSDYLFVGELSLTGEIRPVNGVLPMALRAKESKKKGFIVPKENASEAALIGGLKIIPASSLSEIVKFFSGEKEIEPITEDIKRLFMNNTVSDNINFCDIKGQEHAKRAIEVAAAGGHNLLMVGPPGSGKTMLARRMPSILPDMTFEEAIETTKIYSIAGMLPSKVALVTSRSFRAPHHTISTAGLVGGGQHPRPGEISLSHNGVLFLDEFPEFTKSALEVLRQPLEDGIVTISRASSTSTFPARFMLVAAMNPCRCGYLGDKIKECVCVPSSIRQYKSKISGPLLDRIDIQVEVPRLTKKELVGVSSGESSETIKERVQRARDRQQKNIGDSNLSCNAQMSPRLLKKYCKLSDSAQNFLENAIDKLGLSGRAYDKVLRISKTIADLGERDLIEVEHLAEAIQYRCSNNSNNYYNF